MISKQGKRRLMEKLHRGFVWTMAGITVVTLTCVGLSMYGTIQEVKKKEKIMFAELQSRDDPEEFPTASAPLR